MNNSEMSPAEARHAYRWYMRYWRGMTVKVGLVIAIMIGNFAMVRVFSAPDEPPAWASWGLYVCLALGALVMVLLAAMFVILWVKRPRE